MLPISRHASIPISDMPKKNALKLMVWPREMIPSEVREYIFTMSHGSDTESNTSILNVLANIEGNQKLTKSYKAKRELD